MKIKLLLLLFSFFLVAPFGVAQLRPGFNIEEYCEVLRVSSHMNNMLVDSIYKSSMPRITKRVWKSSDMGFDNAWELWQRNDGVMVVALRATVSTPTSWMANFNAGLVPAVGVSHFGVDRNYRFSTDSAAMVHGGWIAGLLTMTDDIHAKLDSCYRVGRRDFIICGHSQGGGLSYLLTAHLRLRQLEGLLPADVRFKTYCSAAPKPGDYRFALSYEHLTRGGWSFTVVNADDWVPELPLSVQRPTDMNPTNPFASMDELLSHVNLPTRLKMKFLYNRLYKPTQKSSKNISKYLGATVGSMLEGARPAFRKPEYAVSANYARCGNFIVLMPDDDYYRVHPKVSKEAFEHHMYGAYEFLAERYK